VFSKVALRLAAVNSAVFLVILGTVLAGIFLSVRWSLERDTANDLRRIADGANELAIARLATRDTNPLVLVESVPGRATTSREEGEDQEDQEEEYEPYDVRTADGERELGLARVVPAYLFDSQGFLMSGAPVAESRLPSFDSMRAAQLSGEDIRTIDADHGSVTVLTRTLFADGERVGSLQLATSVSSQRRVLSVLATSLPAVAVLATAAATLAGFFLAGRAMKPIERTLTSQRTFIADAAHELRTPVAVIRAGADALDRVAERLHPDDRELLRDIQKESEFLNRVISRLLSAARVEEAQRAEAWERFDLGELVVETVESMRPLATAEGLTIRVEPVASALPVYGDRIDIRLVLMSLVENAIRYNRPAGSVTARTFPESKNAVVEIQDTGVGVPSELREAVFDRFFRVDRARSRRAGGVGLGLSIARGIVDAHGGRISLDSVVDHGTTVRMTIPLTDEHRAGTGPPGLG
jgi:signal transduction histidine kinase